MSRGQAAQPPLRSIGFLPCCQGLLGVILDLTLLPLTKANPDACTRTGQQLLDLLRRRNAPPQRAKSVTASPSAANAWGVP